MSEIYFELSKPIDVLNKAKREFEKMQKDLNTDNIFNFFVTAYHIMDYVKSQGKASHRFRRYGAATTSGHQGQQEYQYTAQMFFHLLPLHKVKTLNERKRSSLFPDMHTPLNPLPGTAICKGFRAIGARCVRHINHLMRL